MLDDFRKNSVEWEYKAPFPGNYSIEWENESPHPGNSNDNMEKMQDESEIVITDIPALAEKLKAQSVCCIGYQSGKGYFPGTDIVLSSWDGLDEAFFEVVYHRFCGNPVILCETERLIIRESQKEDFDQLYHMSLECGDSAFSEKLPEDYREAKEQFEAYIKWQYSFYGFGLWTVVEKATGEIIGRCGLMPALGEVTLGEAALGEAALGEAALGEAALGEAALGKAALEEDAFEEAVLEASVPEESVSEKAESDSGIEVGYLISADRRCRGFAQEAVAAILDFAFEKLECPEVIAVIDRSNVPSKRLAEKLGLHRYTARGCIDAEETVVEVWKKENPEGTGGKTG